MCWRLWYREHLSHSSIAIASASTSAPSAVRLLEQDDNDNSDDEYTDVTSDEDAEDRRYSSFEDANVRDHPAGVSTSGSSQLPSPRPQPPRHCSERLPTRPAASQSSQLVRNRPGNSHTLKRNRTSLTDDGTLHRWSISSSNNCRRPSQYICRSQSAPTAGKIMADLLPDKLVVSKTLPGSLFSERSLSREALSIPTDTSVSTLGPDSTSPNVQGEREPHSNQHSEQSLPHESQPHVVVTPDAVMASPHTPPSRFPKVVKAHPSALRAKSSGAENGGGAISMAAIAEEIAISGHPHSAYDSTAKVMDSRQVCFAFNFFFLFFSSLLFPVFLLPLVFETYESSVVD